MKQVEKLIIGPVSTNTYLVKENNHCLIIDPAANPKKIIEHVQDCIVDAICLTHGHFDHIKAVDALQKYFKCDVYISSEDEEMLRDSKKNESILIDEFVIQSKVKHYETITKINQFEIQVLFAPGHTKGSVLLMMDELMFSGDVIFKEGIGRCDLYGGSFSQMKASLENIKKLNIDYMIYPGHGESTTFYYEVKNNPYF